MRSIALRQLNARAVLDTNIIISGLNFSGRERDILELARVQAYELYLSPFILGEVSSVLTRKFGWDGVRAERVVRLIASWATVLEPEQRVTLVRRNDADNRILECALAAGADYLVTGDRRHLLPLKQLEGVLIVTSSEFLSALGA